MLVPYLWPHYKEINMYVSESTIVLWCLHPVFERNRMPSLFKEAPARWIATISWFYIVIAVTPFALPALVTDSVS